MDNFSKIYWMSKTIIVIGGGVIGVNVAYFLTKKGAKVIIIEKTKVAGGASGKAGGFLAYDWCDSSTVKDLARKSFELHEELANTIKRDYGYRKLDTLSVSYDYEKSSHKLKDLPEWINGGITNYGTIGSKKTTAQVHPELFTNALLEIVLENGGELIIGDAKGISYEKKENGYVMNGLKLSDGSIVKGDSFVLTMGPWSSHIHDWIPSDVKNKVKFNLVTALKANSIVLEPKDPKKITGHALFLTTSVQKNEDPEIYPRPDGTVYICGFSKYIKIPESSDLVLPDEDISERLVGVGKVVSKELEESKIKIKQACCLPDPGRDGSPLIGKVPLFDNLYCATGHYCWGILNSTGTGLAMSELILDGKSSSIDISKFTLDRF